MTVLLPFRHSELDSESRSFLLSGHPDVLPVSILVFAKNGYRRQEPVSHHFRGLSSLPVMPDSLDVILSLTQNHALSSLRVILACSQSGSRSSRKTGTDARSPSVPIFAVFLPFPSCRTLIRHLRSFKRAKERDPV